MNKIQHAGLFVLIVIVLFLAVNCSYNKVVLEKKNIYVASEQFDLYNATQAQIVIFGDSRPARDVNPAFLPNSFNFAILSETYDQTYYKVRTLLSGENNAKIILIPLGPQSFTNYRENPYFDLWYWSQFMTYEELEAVTGKAISRLYIDETYPFFGNGIEFKDAVFLEKHTKIERGWQEVHDIYQPPASLNPNQVRVKPKIEDNLLESYLKILQMADEKGITVVIVRYPITREYDHAFDKRSFNEFYEILEDYADKYPLAHVLNYQTLFEDESYFSDKDHLNAAGAEMFTKQLYADLLELEIITE